MADNFDKTAILDSFLEEVGAYLPEIETSLDRLQQQPDDAAALEEAHRRAHTIGGSAGMMDYFGLARVAQGMESILEDAIDRHVALDAPTVALLRRSHGRVVRILDRIRAGEDDESVAAEDDADRAAWRGPASTPSLMGGAPRPVLDHPTLGGNSGVLDAGYASPDAHTSAGTPSIQMPDWLAAFGNSSAGTPSTSSAASTSGSLAAAGPTGPAPSMQPTAPTRAAASGRLDQPDTQRGNLPHVAPASGGLDGGWYSTPGADQWRQSQPGSVNTAAQNGNFGLGAAHVDGAPSLAEMIQNFSASGNLDLSRASGPLRAATGMTLDSVPAEMTDQPAPAQNGHDITGMGTEALPTVPHPGPFTSGPLGAPPQWTQTGPLGRAPQTSAPPVPSTGSFVVPEWMDTAAHQATSGLPALATESAANASAPASHAIPASASTSAPANTAMPRHVEELRGDVDGVRRQASELRDVIVALREAAQAMEDERGELRGFLDGSQDALDRLEEWAGQHMGLDLRNSPDAVRRYLPLSVIWVVTTRLKKLVTLLHSTSRDVAGTQEQIEDSLHALGDAIDQIGQLSQLSGSIAQLGGAPDGGFRATVAQIEWDPNTTARTPAIEQAAVTEAVPTVSAASRAEIEREVREELRRELEDEVREEIAASLRRDEEQRLRHELEIQVRRQVLADLAPGLGASVPMAAIGAGAGTGLATQMPMVSAPGEHQVQVTSDLSSETLEVFRDEAQEHLQTITGGITLLEREPGNPDALRSVRRAMHTLKGAAGMMGFTLVQQLSHASEDLLERLTDGGIAFSDNVLRLIFDTAEALDSLISGTPPYTGEQQQRTRELIRQYGALTGHAVPDPAALSASTTGPEAIIRAEPSGGSGAAAAIAPQSRTDTAPPASGNTDLSVRLQLSKLDDLVNLFGELLINRSIIEERTDRLNHLVEETVRVSDRLREVGGQLETSFEAAALPSGRPSARGLPSLDLPGVPRWPSQPGAGGQINHQQEFDELELDRYTEFHRLSRGLSEGVADINTLSHEMESLLREILTSFARETRLSSEFQDRLLKARLVPLQSLVSRLYRAARATALKSGKQIDFFVIGGDTEVDRKVLEEVEGPLMHLVRNAVTHGMETPAERARRGKAPAGKLTVSAAYEGNQVVIAVRDDGAGIDPERIRATAAARGWIGPNAQLSQAEAIDLIFRPGLSTAESLTEESGRGVGLDVVRDTVTRLRGTVEVDSQPGQGTTFTMKFPISLQIARAVLVKVGKQTLAIPMASVGQIGRLDYYARVPGPVPALDVRGDQYPLAHLASYLGLPPSNVDDRSPVLLINAGRHHVALLVDSISSQQEVVSKPLGPHLRDVRGVAGATVLGNGQVVLILELHELLALVPAQQAAVTAAPAPRQPQSAATGAHITPQQTATGWPAASERSGALNGAVSGALNGATMPQPAVGAPAPGFVVTPRETLRQPQQPVAIPATAQSSYVLVVDDSPSVRRVVSNMLKAHGWNVQTARDGIEALDVIARERPAAVLLDIEMPRMDGYELMASIRSQQQYRALPLVVLTSRAATKHQQRALQLGADAYVIKPYQDEELLRTIATLVQARG